jgi:hypothetical protein
MNGKMKLMAVGIVALAAALGGCKKGGTLGDTCTTTQDCNEPLVCDPGTSTCQNAGGTDGAPGTDANGPGTDANGPGTDANSPGTDAAAPGTDAAPVACSMSGNDCADWCTSYLANCATDDNFPSGYNTGTCMSDCAALSPTAVDCRAYHACFAGKGGIADADSHCDHAIGLAICM